MCTKEEIEKLAYYIWEKEGKPQGKALQNYLLAEQILLNLETTQLARDVTDVKNLLRASEKTARYHFQFSFAVAFLAIGATLSLLNPPIDIAGIKSSVWGGILSLVSLILIVLSDVLFKPEAFNIRRVKVATWVMLAGVIMIPTGSLIIHVNFNLFASILQLGGILVFIVGLYLAIFSKQKLVIKEDANSPNQHV
jgi:hypothetical protein